MAPNNSRPEKIPQQASAEWRGKLSTEGQKTWEEKSGYNKTKQLSKDMKTRNTVKCFYYSLFFPDWNCGLVQFISLKSATSSGPKTQGIVGREERRY